MRKTTKKFILSFIVVFIKIEAPFQTSRILITLFLIERAM